MKYELMVEDKLNWINYIEEVHNTQEVLILIVDFKPKYLDCANTSMFDSETHHHWTGFDFIKGEDTIYAEGEQIGSVMVDAGEYILKYVDFFKYEAHIVIIKQNAGPSRIVYPPDKVD